MLTPTTSISLSRGDVPTLQCALRHLITRKLPATAPSQENLSLLRWGNSGVPDHVVGTIRTDLCAHYGHERDLLWAYAHANIPILAQQERNRAKASIRVLHADLSHYPIRVLSPYEHVLAWGVWEARAYMLGCLSRAAYKARLARVPEILGAPLQDVEDVVAGLYPLVEARLLARTPAHRAFAPVVPSDLDWHPLPATSLRLREERAPLDAFADLVAAVCSDRPGLRVGVVAQTLRKLSSPDAGEKSADLSVTTEEGWQLALLWSLLLGCPTGLGGGWPPSCFEVHHERRKQRSSRNTSPRRVARDRAGQ